jgi:hypothetical protein
MEARQTFRGSAIPKALLVVLAMCAAVLLAVGASFITKNLSGSGSTITNVRPAPGTVLRQDYQGPHAAQSAAPIQHQSAEDMPGFRP